MKKFKIKSFCKINLSLNVFKNTSAGYHNIRSLITFCDLYDVITISNNNGIKDQITFSGRFKKGINKKNNTITKILYLLRKHKCLVKQTFKINIKKNIPHGSGLGGGSSNAGSLLNFFNSKMHLNLTNEEMIRIASKVGYDTPVILKKKNTFLTGLKGEFLKLKQKFNLNILIVFPNIICSTKKIYQKNKKFTHLKLQSSFNIKKKNQLIKFLKQDSNDLEKTVTQLYPRIKKIINLISIQNGCYFSRITGSGSACIGIFSNRSTAIFTQKLIKLKFPKYWSVVSKTI